MKKNLLYIILLFIIIAIMIIDNIYTNNAVNTCIDNGQKASICNDLYNN